MTVRPSNRTRAGSLLLGLLLALSCNPSGRQPAAKAQDTGAADPTLTRHADLGFTAEVPFSAHPQACDSALGVFCYDIAFSGTARVTAKVATDLAFTYDAGQLVAGEALPFQLAYTPTAGASLAVVDVAGTAVIDFTGCANCPYTAPLTLASGSAAFTAPLGSDPAIGVAGSSSGITLSAGPFPVATLSVSSDLDLAPAPAQALPGLGGAAANLAASGASLGSFPIVEWDAAGQVASGTLQLPADVSGGLDLSLSPVIHWVGTSGSAQLDIQLSSELKTAVEVALDVASAGICLIADCSIGDPAPVPLFSGGFGPIYQSAGLDTAVGDAIGGPAGPLVANRVADGFVPIPLFAPALPTLPPIPSTLGAVVFSVPGVAIAGAPADALLSGATVALDSVVSGGTPPFVYHWLKDGAAFASTPSLADVPAVGSTTYGLYVVDAAGAVSNTATVVVNAYDLAIALAPAAQTIPFGASTTYTVSVVLTGGAGLAGVPASVATALAGLPAGATATGFPASLPLSTTPSTATFTVSTLQTTPVGTYPLTATATTDTGSRAAVADLVVITPQQAAQNLLATIAGMGLPHGVETSLAASLGTLVAHIDAGNLGASCGKLGAFVAKVNADLGNGRLTPAQATELLLLASQLRASLGC